MKIAIIIGSIRQGRQSQKIAHYLQHNLTGQGHHIDLVDLAATPLPMLEERVGKHPQLPAVVQDLSNRLHAADAVIMVTPEYHGSFSGVLKNALDYFYSEFSRKVVGIVTVSAGKLGGINAATQLQHVILSLGAFPLPTKLLVPEVYGAFNEAQELTSDITTRSAQRFIDEFQWLATAITEKKQQAVTGI
ncbi:MAG: NAD(P)H-dependent oxidoreductase [Chitinophaga sp.]|uniref:NADPH-dependent FMN reductase n=1 Tax=Chitinophaga sp. TaxID=1869181 RepID=UPI001B051D2B|nr:NAD(P)H-dependent oxidoreductase [Chitinophaga sp.]MBO9731963.1 NAD(P)H-dependent oxidoreductase [Chitinophaga sp.]